MGEHSFTGIPQFSDFTSRSGRNRIDVSAPMTASTTFARPAAQSFGFGYHAPGRFARVPGIHRGDALRNAAAAAGQFAPAAPPRPSLQARTGATRSWSASRKSCKTVEITLQPGVTVRLNARKPTASGIFAKPRADARQLPVG